MSSVCPSARTTERGRAQPGLGRGGGGTLASRGATPPYSRPQESEPARRASARRTDEPPAGRLVAQPRDGAAPLDLELGRARARERGHDALAQLLLLFRRWATAIPPDQHRQDGRHHGEDDQAAIAPHGRPT